MEIAEIHLKDPVFKKIEKYSKVDNFFLRFIRDERDLPFIHLCLKITFFILPVAIYLFLSNKFSWWIAVPYLVFNIAVMLGPYVLMLHNTSHRKLFKEEYQFMNNYIPWILGPFYGESPETYFYHHVGMHHAENNLSADISSTMEYQRDSFIDFLKYFGRFFLFGIVELSMYFKKKNRSRFLKKILLGEFSFILMCIALSLFNWQATLAVFVLPFFFVRFAMMAGNWAQHAFIDPSDPGNSYRNSITCINTVYNKNCFNDGYHIGHHLSPIMHWTDMPKNFQDNKEKYVLNKSVVFKEVDYFFIWFLLMTHSYKYLANKFVDISGAYHSQEEIIAFLKSRTKKF
jgi:fatty acid desaturase